VVRALDAEDVAMRDFQLHAPTLDDVFLSKTGRKLDAGDEEGTGEHPEAVPA
jgi:ABC-2 type transport system ATP-binding protein